MVCCKWFHRNIFEGALWAGSQGEPLILKIRLFRIIRKNTSGSSFKAAPITKGNPSNKGKASTSQGLQAAPSRTPKKSSCLTKTKTPTSHKKKPFTPQTPSLKADPFQMNSKNMPESFSTTRDVLYVHIKPLWVLFEQKTVPRPPSMDMVRESHSQFSSSEMIENTASNKGAPSLIPVKKVVTFASLEEGLKKVR
ncbi:hypothetical protein VP01_3414g1 [Puccinia sorghi]|uniref:Uncharacterized protein n=1 Tax=Puccinia sorghi TaxID=27349 RepID=A0A0L6UWI1_9BASI|nr:hypothetical protein VP01_3414g1 [Puccinia sorghi]